MRYWIISIGFLVFSFSNIKCKQREKAIKNITKDSCYINLTKTPCFGKCPAYTLKLFSNGIAFFEGKANVELIGNYVGTLNQSTTDSIFLIFNNSNFFEFKNEYNTQVTDVPTTYLKYHKSNKEIKEIKDRFGGPRELKDLEKQIERTINKINWIEKE